MTINPLSANLIHLLSPNSAISGDTNRLPGIAANGESEMNFANILNETLANASQADAADKASALQLLIGESDDLAGLMLDAQKAELALNLALQIRNKVIDAYNEVMRMQV